MKTAIKVAIRYLGGKLVSSAAGLIVDKAVNKSYKPNSLTERIGVSLFASSMAYPLDSLVHKFLGRILGIDRIDDHTLMRMIREEQKDQEASQDLQSS